MGLSTWFQVLDFELSGFVYLIFVYFNSSWEWNALNLEWRELGGANLRRIWTYIRWNPRGQYRIHTSCTNTLYKYIPYAVHIYIHTIYMHIYTVLHIHVYFFTWLWPTLVVLHKSTMERSDYTEHTEHDCHTLHCAHWAHWARLSTLHWVHWARSSYTTLSTVVPVPKSPQTGLSTYFKFPYTSSECKSSPCQKSPQTGRSTHSKSPYTSSECKSSPCQSHPKRDFLLIPNPLYLIWMQDTRLSTYTIDICKKSGILECCVGPGAYFAHTLAGKRCIYELALTNLCFRI